MDYLVGGTILAIYILISTVVSRKEMTRVEFWFFPVLLSIIATAEVKLYESLWISSITVVLRFVFNGLNCICSNTGK